MSVPAPIVAVASALVCSPVAWLLYQGLVTGQDAVERVVILGVALNVLAALAFPAPTRAVAPPPETGETDAQPVSSEVL